MNGALPWEKKTRRKLEPPRITTASAQAQVALGLNKLILHNKIHIFRVLSCINHIETKTKSFREL